MAPTGIPAGGKRCFWKRHPLLLLAFAPVIPQIIGSTFNIWYNLLNVEPLLRSQAEHDRLEATMLAYNAVVYPLAVAVWLWVVLRLRGPLRKLGIGEHVEAASLVAARRHAINLPWWGAGVAAAGWLLCLPVFLGSLAELPGSIDPRLHWHLPVSFLVAASIAVTHTFFLTEIVGQRFLFPGLFRDARPAETPGAVAISIRSRGIALAVSAGIYPIVSIFLILAAPHADLDTADRFVGFVGVVGIAFGLVTAWMLGRWIVEPLALLRRASSAVASGNLDARIPLLRADEFGTVIDEFNDMVVELREKQRLREMFGLHVGRQALDNILKQNPGASGVMETITVLFFDIRDFTRRCGACSAQDIVALLNELLHEMVAAVEEEHGGMVNKFLGDGFMALFGVGGAQADHAGAACAAARAMLERLDRFNGRAFECGRTSLRAGIGINTGDAIVGSIGSSRRLEYTAIGDTVNVASRLEKLTKALGVPILIAESTRAALRSPIPLREFPPQRVRGVPDPLLVYGIERSERHLVPARGG